MTTTNQQPGGEALAAFGAYVRALRQAKGLTLRALAARVGLDFTTISKLECARLDGPPSTAVICRMAEVLGGEAARMLALAGQLPPGLRAATLDNPLLVELLWALSERRPQDGAYVALIEMARRASTHAQEGEARQ